MHKLAWFGAICTVLAATDSAFAGNFRVAGTLPYVDTLPNDIEVAVKVEKLASVGDANNFQDGPWSDGTTVHQFNSVTVRWVGPPEPALVDMPVTFGYDFTSDAQVAYVTGAWWTLNGVRISEVTDSFTVVPGSQPNTFHVAGTLPYVDTLPNDIEVAVKVEKLASVGDASNFQDGPWSDGTTMHQFNSVSVRWVGPPEPALVDMPVTFGYDFTSDAQVAYVTGAWWTLNGVQIDEVTDSFTVVPVPEPASLTLAALGLGLIACNRRWIRRCR